MHCKRATGGKGRETCRKEVVFHCQRSCRSQSGKEAERENERTYSTGQELWVQAITRLGVRRLQREHLKTHSQTSTKLNTQTLLLVQYDCSNIESRKKSFDSDGRKPKPPVCYVFFTEMKTHFLMSHVMF